MAIRAVVTTQSETASVKPDIAKLRLLEESAARYLGFLTRAKKNIRNVNNGEYKVQERRPRAAVTQINNGGGYNSSATDLVVDDSTFWTAGDLGYLPASGEMVLVGAVTVGTHTLTVTRGVGTTAATIADDAYILRYSRMAEEGYTVGESWVTSTTQVTNYAGIISTPVEWTRYQLKEWSYLGKGEKDNRMAADQEAMAIEHLKDCEKHILLSNKFQSVSSSKATRGTEGLIPTCVTNVYNHGGAADVTHAEFRANIIRPLHNVTGHPEKTMLASNIALELMEGFGLGLNRYYPDEKMSHELGFPVTKYRTSRGYVNIAHHPIFDEMTTYLDEALVAYDENFVQLAILEDTKYEEDLSPKNKKTHLDEWNSCIGTSISYEEAIVFADDLAG